MRYPMLMLTLVLAAILAAPAWAAEFPIEQVDGAISGVAQQLPGPVYKYSWPRTDLRVQVDATDVAPGLALGSWAAFMPGPGGKAEVMGDLVLLESEVNPVVAVLNSEGLLVTGIHNHLAREIPPLRYVHLMGSGDPVALARGIKAALEKTATPLYPRPATQKRGLELPNWANEIAKTLGRKGQLSGAVYSVGVPRADTVRVDGEPTPPAMGLAIALNFERSGDEVASTGDFVLVASEVNPVIEALQQHHIEVTALHNHMLDDQPHLFFVHYWAVGKPASIAKGLEAALEHVNVKPAS